MLPSMWRVELLHPLFIHLPIGVLTTAVLLRVIGFVFASGRKPRAWANFSFATGQLLTVIGALGAWPAYVTGNWAEEEVNSVLCDPTITHLHGDWALYVTLLFSFIAFIDLVGFWTRRSSKTMNSAGAVLQTKGVKAIVCLIALLGLGMLGYVGHLGASLVYQQGAGVHHPSPQCTEFE